MGGRLELIKFLDKWIVADLASFRTAIACNCPVFFGFGVKKDFKNYFFQVGEISHGDIKLDSAQSKDDAAKVLAQNFFNILESYVRRYPEQWFNWYDYFSWSDSLKQTYIRISHSEIANKNSEQELPKASKLESDKSSA